MKSFFSFFIVSCFFIGTAEARQCFGLFSTQKISDLDRAILNGVEIFNRNKEFVGKESTDVVYLHGTSVESVRRSLEGNYFIGTPMSDLPRMSQVFSHFLNMKVVHAFTNRNRELIESDFRTITAYAALAAKRFYLLRFLQNPKEFYNSEFLYELIDALESTGSQRAVVDYYQSEGFFATTPDVLAKLQSAELSFLTKKMSQRRGVVIIFKSSVEKHVVLEKDLEQDHAMALISKNGIPLRDIEAIVPLSITERDELLQLLSSHRN